MNHSGRYENGGGGREGAPPTIGGRSPLVSHQDTIFNPNNADDDEFQLPEDTVLQFCLGEVNAFQLADTMQYAFAHIGALTGMCCLIGCWSN
jgi:hypothetical protein